jgi:hypothetical protein
VPVATRSNRPVAITVEYRFIASSVRRSFI